MEMPIAGGVLSYTDEGRGEPVVLVHGFPLSGAFWDAQATALAGEMRVIRPDLRGLGKSNVRANGPILLETLAGDLAALLDTLELERATIVGHSLGAAVALELYRMFEDRFAALGLVGARMFGEDDTRRGERMRLADRTEAEGMEALVDAYIPRYFAPSVYEQRPALVALAEREIRARDPHQAAAVLRGVAMRNATDDILPEITCRTGLLVGEYDVITLHEDHVRAAELIPGAELHVLHDCGHSPMLERADDVTRFIRDLVRG